MEHLKVAEPVLASLDIFRTVAFYKEKLGFDRVGWKDKEYAIVHRDQVTLHFWKCDDKIHPENTSCYIRVQDVDGLYEELKPQGVIHPNAPLRDEPWGMREFAILDGDGNMIRFGQSSKIF
jgi:catechol 2,3-dioxygenase-like lactoylglutathione lyase family enzyme